MSTYPSKRVTNVSPPLANSFRQMKGIEYRSRLDGSVSARTTVVGRYDGGGAGASGRRWVIPSEVFVSSRVGRRPSCGPSFSFCEEEVEW
jgi:hypothetical protein